MAEEVTRGGVRCVGRGLCGADIVGNKVVGEEDEIVITVFEGSRLRRCDLFCTKLYGITK